MNYEDTITSIFTCIIFFGIAALAVYHARDRSEPPADATDDPAPPLERRHAPRRTATISEYSATLEQAIYIERCSDPLMWYAKKVGQCVPFVRAIPQEGIFMSREPAGYTNIVKMSDARLIVVRKDPK